MQINLHLIEYFIFPMCELFTRIKLVIVKLTTIQKLKLIFTKNLVNISECVAGLDLGISVQKGVSERLLEQVCGPIIACF